jgi:hypothetical protein
MNLVEIATYIQDGYKKYYNTPLCDRGELQFDRKQIIMRYVMQKTKGHINPTQIDLLITMETSIDDIYNNDENKLK